MSRPCHDRAFVCLGSPSDVNVVQPNLPPAISKLIQRTAANTGGIKVQPATLEVTCEPIFRKARPVPFGLQSAVKQNIEELVQKGILLPVHSSSWARICGDYRVTVNPHLKQTATTTRQVEDMFEGLNGSIVFSKVDLTNAFLQVPLDTRSKELTTIHTIWGLYQYQFLPFGLTISPGIFQSVIDGIIQDLPGVRSYQDDIIVYGNSQQQHDDRLYQLLDALNDSNVQINQKKSVFSVPSLTYLGYSIDGDGIHPNLERIRAVQKAPKPTTAKQLQSFLGFAQLGL